ncbi:DUF4136 domain-containing protein [Pelagicoccus sp. SDUM812002]|uniref:DUF4136 domain-containing protein n=1 Tax=Pelagicoccus sp. SDUM812002 TaxID=3041266 RepID=UPI00280D1015|nr:DUF4136 domain-containing protein [Pelagicoccus sp. SDUM812002]MDQ8187261.1 DUF4136 domain-containing protein [Pelagicoccus sp. SDUM812002]
MRIFAATPLFLCFLLTSCSSLSVQHEFNPQVDFTRLKTFGVLPSPHPEFDPVAKAVFGFDGFALAVASNVLEEKGFSREQDSAADFFLGLRIDVGPEGQVHSPLQADSSGMLVMRGWDPGGVVKNLGQRVPVYEPKSRYESDPGDHLGKLGDVTIYLYVDVFDAASRDLAWQGWATARSLGEFNTDIKRAKVVAEILKPFPN